MSVTNLDEFKSVDQLKQELVMVNRELKAAMVTITRLLKDANVKQEKIKQLESLLSQNTPVIKKNQEKIVVSVSSEEEIADSQLERLRQTSRNRVLTLEEIRAYDLLVKNKRLSNDASTINLGKDQYKNVTDDELTKLASTEIKMIESPDGDEE